MDIIENYIYEGNKQPSMVDVHYDMDTSIGCTNNGLPNWGNLGIAIAPVYTYNLTPLIINGYASAR